MERVDGRRRGEVEQGCAVMEKCPAALGSESFDKRRNDARNASKLHKVRYDQKYKRDKGENVCV